MVKKKYYEIISIVDEVESTTAITNSLYNAVGIASSLILKDDINSVVINKEINYEPD